MSKKTSIAALAVFIVAAAILGLLLLNKGDGPIMQMMIADKPTADTADFEAMKSSGEKGVFVLLEKEFNQFKEKGNEGIPAGKDLYANVYFVESPKGSGYTAKWINAGVVVKEEIKELTTDQKGVISYKLEGNSLTSGNYVLEIYREGNKLFEYAFPVK